MSWNVDAPPEASQPEPRWTPFLVGMSLNIKACSTVDRIQDLAAGSMLSSVPQSHWLPGTRRAARHLNTDMFKGDFSIGIVFA